MGIAPPQADESEPEKPSAAWTPGCGCWSFFAGLILLGFVFYCLVERSKYTRSKRSDAQTVCKVIFNALDQFVEEYGHLPTPNNEVKEKDWDTDSGAAGNLIYILTGRDKQANPKEIDFIGDIKDAKIEDGKHINGVLLTETSSALFDPWGNLYLVRLDGDGDGFVADPNPEIPGNRIARKAIAWSAGKDGDPATWKDNAANWTSAW